MNFDNTNKERFMVIFRQFLKGFGKFLLMIIGGIFIIFWEILKMMWKYITEDAWK